MEGKEKRRDRDRVTHTRALLDRYLRGDRESERRLFEACRAELLTKVRREPWMAGTKRWLAAEDLVDEVLLRALSSGLLRRFEDRGRGTLARALAKILDDVVVDTYRRHGAERRGGGAAPLSYDRGAETGETERTGILAVADGTTPTAGARANELVELCRRVLDGREWEVWRAREIEGLEYSEVARRMGITESAARGVFRRARLQIVRALKPVDGESEGEHPA